MSYDNYQYEDIVPGGGEDRQHGVEDDSNDSHIRFPVALEKALDLKNERIKDSWIDDDETDGTFYAAPVQSLGLLFSSKPLNVSSRCCKREITVRCS